MMMRRSVILVACTMFLAVGTDGYGPPPTKGGKRRTTTTSTTEASLVPTPVDPTGSESGPYPSSPSQGGSPNSVYYGGSPQPPPPSGSPSSSSPEGGGNFWWQGPASPFSPGQEPASAPGPGASHLGPPPHPQHPAASGPSGPSYPSQPPGPGGSFPSSSAPQIPPPGQQGTPFPSKPVDFANNPFLGPALGVGSPGVGSPASNGCGSSPSGGPGCVHPSSPHSSPDRPTGNTYPSPIQGGSQPACGAGGGCSGGGYNPQQPGNNYPGGGAGSFCAPGTGCGGGNGQKPRPSPTAVPQGNHQPSTSVVNIPEPAGAAPGGGRPSYPSYQYPPSQAGGPTGSNQFQPQLGAGQGPAAGVECSKPGYLCVARASCPQGQLLQTGAPGRAGVCNAAAEVCCKIPTSAISGQYPPSIGYGNQQRPGTNGIPIGGSIYDQQPSSINGAPPSVTPAPTQQPYTGPLNTTPYPGCSAALKCVPISYCTAEGVMSDAPVQLTREQHENRVPLTDCMDLDTNRQGKCCRDPNYKDPWPAGMMMGKTSPSGKEGGFDDGQYHPPGTEEPHDDGQYHPPSVPEQETSDTFSHEAGLYYNVVSSTPKGHTIKKPIGNFNQKPAPFPTKPSFLPDNGVSPSRSPAPVYEPEYPGGINPPSNNILPPDSDSPGKPTSPISGPTAQFGQPGKPLQPGQPNQSGHFPSQPGYQPNQLPQLSQPGFNPSQPGQPNYQPGQTGSGYNPNQPGNQPGQPGQPGPSQPGYNPSQPGQPSYQPGQPDQTGPGYNPNQPSNQPGYNPSQPGQPSYQPGQPGQTGPGYNPNQPSNQPGYNPSQPGQPSYQPGQPGNQPGEPRPGQPGYNPSQPGQSSYQPGQPGQPGPGQPGYNPSQPSYQPGQTGPGYNPNQPGNQPGQPDQPGPGQPGYNPSQPSYQPGQTGPGYNPNQPGNQPGQPGPGQPGYNPSQPGQPSYQPGQPGQTGPGYNPNQPGNQPGQPRPGYNPSQPGQSGYNPSHPSQPGHFPSQPGYQPSQPSFQQGQPGQSVHGPGFQTGLQGRPVQPQQHGITNQPGTSQPVQGYPLGQPAPGTSCGIRHNKVDSSSGPEDAGFAEFPWQALVTSAGNKTYLCGAAIVSDKAVITAAHCVEGLRSKEILIKVGEWRLLSPSLKPVQVRPAAAVARHPQFDAGNLSNDLAIIIVTQAFIFDDHVDKICLPGGGSQPGTSSRPHSDKATCVVTGWGRKALKGPIPDSVLHKVDVNLVEGAQCETKLKATHLGKYFVLNKGFSCALPKTSSDLCKVDVGGPLACDRGDGHYELAGVNSWDVGCQAPEQTPTVFSEPDAEWIDRIINKTPAEKLAEEEDAYFASKLKGESLEQVDIDQKPGFALGYGK